MQYFKLQIGCLLVVLYVAFIYFIEKRKHKIPCKDTIFGWLVFTSISCIAFDGITAYTVNHLNSLPLKLNNLFHMLYLKSMDAAIFLMFLYVLDITVGVPKKRKSRVLLSIPFIINIAIVILFMPKIHYAYGKYTNYSEGVSVYTCFIMVATYMAASLILLAVGWKNMGHHRKITITTCIIPSILVSFVTWLFPESLLTSIAPTLVVLGIYLNMENPLFTKLQAHNKEMVMNFATLVENRDGSTGGHIKRTTAYVQLLAEELKKRCLYKDELTPSFINNLLMAAPMHDIGKIAIPDAILQKPGKLTDEEYDIMKTHADKGGKIIEETFGHSDDEEYEKIAFEVARHHHEKWNGKGYPDDLVRKDIPLCARIMAIADVFDAVSAKRCYRDAMPLEKCFEIIEKGSGTDFDPVIADVFLDIKEKIVEVYSKSRQ